MPEANLFVRKLKVKSTLSTPQEWPLEKLVKNAQQQYGLEAFSVTSCFARFWYQDNCGQSPYCGDCLVGHAGCAQFLKPCNTFGAAVLQNISGGILSGL